MRLYRLPALLIAVVALSLTPTSTLAVVYPTVTLNPSSGPPGQKFVATGVNFHPNTTIYAVETVLRLTTTSDAAGNMTMYFQVDSSSPPRSVRIQFFEGNMHGTPIAGAVFTVTGPPNPPPPPVTGHPPPPVTVPQTPVSPDILPPSDTQQPPTTPTPASAPTNPSETASGTPGSRCRDGDATVYLERTSIWAGKAFSATGSCFVPNALVTIILGFIPPLSTTTDADGNFTIKVGVPADTPPGIYKIAFEQSVDFNGKRIVVWRPFNFAVMADDRGISGRHEDLGSEGRHEVIMIIIDVGEHILKLLLK